MKLLHPVLALVMLCGIGLCNARAENAVTDIKILPVIEGLNHLTSEEGDLPEVMAMRAWREYGTARSHSVFRIFVKRRTSEGVGGLLDVSNVNSKGEDDVISTA